MMIRVGILQYFWSRNSGNWSGNLFFHYLKYSMILFENLGSYLFSYIWDFILKNLGKNIKKYKIGEIETILGLGTTPL